MNLKSVGESYLAAKMAAGKFFQKPILLIKDHLHLLFKSAEDNQLHIQQCQQDADGTYQCNIKFDSYSELKRYQKKVRRITVSLSSAVAMVLIAVLVSPYVFNPNRSGASSYAWSQSSWGGVADSSYATAASNKTNWTNYGSKDAAVTASASAVSLASTAGSVTQTTDADFSGTNSNTAVTGNHIELAPSLPGFQSSGIYTSGIINTGQKNISWGNVSWNSTLNGQTISIKARTGNQSDLSDAPAFSAITATTTSAAGTDYGYISKWGSSGSGDGQFNSPWGIAIDKNTGNIFVADTSNNRIQKFSSTGTFLAKWGTAGSGDGQFSNPLGIAVDSTGNVYVADSTNNRIQKFSSAGTFITKWGTSGSGDGQFSSPIGIAVSSDDSLYVSEFSNNRIQKFSSVGTFITKWGSAGAGDGLFDSPGGIAVDSLGNVYVVDGGHYRIQKFSATGTFLTKWGSSGSGDGQFSGLQGVATDSSGNVYVVDASNKRVQKFSSTGVFATKWGTSGNGDGQFIGPRGITTDTSGNIYVVDDNNRRVQKFNVTNSLSYLGAQSGHRYIQYQATLSTTDTSKTPTLDDLTLNFSYYPTALQKVISSPFNSQDKYTSVSNMTWTATNDNPATQGTMEFQLRTAPDNGSGSPDWTNGSGWCGASDCNSDKSDSAYATSYYTTKAGSNAFSTQADHANNQWIQYAMFLKSFDGTTTPSLSNVTTNFAYNNPPSVTLSNATQLSSGADAGKIQTDYVMNETATEQTSAYPELFYQPDNITLKNDTTLGGTEDIVLTTPENIPVPNSGTILLDKELIAYTGKTVDSSTQTTLTGIIRGQDFVSGDNYKTESVVHTSGASIFFKTSSPTGQINSSLVTNTSTKTALWDPKSDANLDGAKWNNFKIAVAANDNDAYGNRVGVATSNAFTVDLEKPTITSITSATPSGKYKAGATIPLDINFSEPITFDSTGGKTITLTLDSQNDQEQNITCTISQTITNSSKATCSYNVGSSDNTQQGQYLTVNAISTSGTINDQYANALSDFTFPTNLDTSSQLIIDTTAPQVSDVAPTENSFINDVTGNGTSKISYTVSDLNAPLSNSSKIVLTRTGGSVDANSPHTCTLQGTALDAGTHANFRLIQGANNCQEVQTILVSGAVYTMEVTAMDSSGISNIQNYTVSDNTSNLPTSSTAGGFANSGTYGQFTSNTEQNETPGNGASVRLVGPNCGPGITTSRDGITYGTVVGADGKCWLDRNLGATRVATSFDDTQAYGWLFQWGRGVDGHQIATSGFTSTLSSGDIPGHANFIKATSSPYDWRSPQNNNLWQGINGINNPCPTGFRLPTGGAYTAPGTNGLGEWAHLISASGITNYNTAFSSSLKLTVAGDREDATLMNRGSYGFYWSSSVSGINAIDLTFDSTSVSSAYTYPRSFGFAVRCVKEDAVKIGYSSSGIYTSYIDGDLSSPIWSTFSYSGTFPSSATTIAFKIVGTNSTSTPSAGTFSGAACSISAVNASGTYSFSGDCATALSGQRYLWYQATLASTDPTQTPTLDDVSASTTTFTPGGNSTTSSSSNITFDTTAPTVSIVTPDTASDGKIYFNQDQTKLSITHDENLRSNTGQSTDSEKNYLKFTNSTDSNDTKTCYLSGTVLTASPHNLDLANDCEGGITLTSNTNYKVDFHAVDLASNKSDATQKTNVVFDTTAPVLSEFQTSSPASDPDTNTNIYTVTNNQINIRAKFNEAIKDGSSIWVILDNTAATPNYVHLDQKVTGDETLLEGTYTVLGPQLGHDADPLNIKSVANDVDHPESITDLAGNIQTDSNSQMAMINSSNKNLGDYRRLVVYTTPPTLEKFTATAGSFKRGDSVTLTAKYKSRVAAGSTISVRLNSGRTIELNDLSNDTIYKTFSLDDSDTNTDKLQVEEITAQNVVDTIGNVLSDSGIFAEYNTNHPTNQITNIQSDSTYTQIDYDAPQLGSTPITIANTNGKTSTPTPTITLNATDNFDLSDGKVLFSLNGTDWCTPIDYNSTITTFNITSNSCGGNTANGTKTISAKFRDVAGNESSTASANIDYDNLKPQLQKLTTDTQTGVYGPGTNINVVATYDEEISDGTLIVQLNNGAQINLDNVFNDNENAVHTVSGTYPVGTIDEDISNLRVASIVSQSISDTSDPVNIQDGTSLSAITENLDTSKTIEIDTTAPTGTVTVDRSKDNGQIHIDATDIHSQDMRVQIISLRDHTQSCSGSTFVSLDWSAIYADNINSDISDNSGNAKKVCVRFKDQVGNISGIVETLTPETPTGVQIDDISNSEISFYGSMLTWQIPVVKGTTDGSGDSFKQYEVARCVSGDSNECPQSFADNVNTIDDPERNYFVDTGLTQDVTYCYQVRFKDDHGNYSSLSTNTCFQAGHAPAATDSEVTIVSGNPDDIQISNVTEQGATVFFQTRDSKYNRPVATKATIEVFTNATLSPETLVATTPAESEFAVVHTIHITGLESGTQYYLKITAVDSSIEGNQGRVGVLAYSPDGIPALTFTTLGTLKTISDVSESIITDSKAVITFETDQQAKCLIDFKEDVLADYNEISDPEKDYYKNHSVTLTGLFEKRNYDYKITCIDKMNSSVTSDDHHFMTLAKGLTQGDVDAQLDNTAPEISSVSIESITGESATVKWNTNEVANSLVTYEVEGSTYSMMMGDDEVNSSKDKFSTAHAVTLNNLIPSAKYLFTVVSYDKAGNIKISSQSSFTTKQPSGLSSIKVVSKALGQATVSWTTGESITSLVEYGLSTSYGEKKENSSKVKEHELTITDLKAGEEYHLRVKGTSSSGELFASSDITFQPKSPPKISDFKIDSIFEHGATVTFNTNVSTDAIIIFNDTDKEENSGVQGNPTISTKHEIKLRDLASGSTFGIKVKVKDEEGNEMEETFPNFTTTRDENPPTFDKIKTDSALTQNDKVQAIISWSTNEMATGSVVYREGKNGDPKTFVVNTVPSFNHVAVITSFKPGTVYYFNAKSTDESGNEGKSSDYAVLTPKKSQNIIQIIVGDFQDIFKWAKF